MNTRTCLFVRRPFKGSFAYEWQIGPFVFQWFHGTGTRRPWRDRRDVGRLSVWRDPYWRA